MLSDISQVTLLDHVEYKTEQQGPFLIDPLYTPDQHALIEPVSEHKPDIKISIPVRCKDVKRFLQEEEEVMWLPA